MQGRRQALLLWLQAVAGCHIQQIREIRDGRLLQILLSKIQGFQFKEQSKTVPEWKKNYEKLKQIYDQQTSLLLKNSKMNVPNQLSTMNLVQIAKGESEQGLETLLYLTFIVCIQSSIKNQFITCILDFHNEAQQELMIIIKESSYEKEQENDRQTQICQYKRTISRLQLEVQRLQYENQSLSQALYEDEDRTRKNQQLLRKLQKQIQELNRQLLQKSQMLINQREELMLTNYSSINEDYVEELKKKLIQSQQTYTEEISNLKESINNLKAQNNELKRQHSQILQDQKKRSFIHSREEHKNCISSEKHKAKLNQVFLASRQASQKEMAVKIQNVKLKNTLAEMELKVKKVNEQLYRKNNEFLVNKQDAGKLKVQFFSRIRDSLKTKLAEYKLKQNNNYADFLQNDGNQQK